MTYDVLAVGNAIVDLRARVNDQVLKHLNINKGVMTLVNEETQANVLASLSSNEVEMSSGGSAANTLCAITQCGAKCVYVGKVSEDVQGFFYKDDLQKIGIDFPVKPAATGRTGTCVVLTTPDAERTMLTHLGISIGITDQDIDPALIQKCKFVYLEGYLFDSLSTRSALLAAKKLAIQNKKTTGFTLSDPFLVTRYRQELLDFITDIDWVFCNEHEAQIAANSESRLEAFNFLAQKARNVVMTVGSEGAWIKSSGSSDIKKVAGFKRSAVDTNGAGDNFAGGFIRGLIAGLSPEKCATLGNYLAAEVVTQYGARLHKKLDINQLEQLT